VAAIKWLAGLALKEKCAPSWGFLSSVSAPNLFITGRLAMTTETRYFLTNFFLEKNREKIKEFEWDVCELPHGKTRATTFICGLTVMPRTLSPERKKRAWDYITFLSSETGQNVYAEVNNGLPARMDVARRMVNHPGVPPGNDVAFINAIDYARYFYWPFPSDEAFAAARSEFMGVWTGNLQVEDVCRRVSYSITRSVDDFFRKNPGAHLPVKTKWVPFDKRPPADANSEIPPPPHVKSLELNDSAR
jgi:ABC-type glycerol-3-phosphate transport system substrate-binding protein